MPRRCRATRRCSSAWRISSSPRCSRPLPTPGRSGPGALEILTGAALPILDRWFESEQLKIALATDAIIGAMASPTVPGTAYVLFHHVMGECNGVRGMWGYVRGGMGGITQALASAARAHGAEVRVNSPVTKIVT